MRIARVIAIIVLAVAALVGTAGISKMWRSSAGIDFYQFWVGGQEAGRIDDFYSPATRARIGEEYVRRASEQSSARFKAVAEFRRDMEWYSTPLQYTFFALFGGDDYDGSLATFQFLSLLSFVIAFAVLARALGLTLLRALVLYDFIVFFFEPLRSDTRVVSVNAIVLLALAIAIWATVKKRFGLAGAILALTVLFKPYVAMVFPVIYALMIIERRWRDLRAHAIGAIAGGAIGVLLSAWRFKSLTIWIDWVNALRAIPETSVTADLGNYALARLFAVPNLTLMLTIAFLAIAIAVLAWRKRGDDASAIGIGVVITFLGATLVWPHYLLLTIPLIAYLVRADELPPVIAGGLAAVLLAFDVVPEARTQAMIVNAGLVILFAAALTWRTAPPRLPAAPAKESPGPPRKTRSSRSRA